LAPCEGNHVDQHIPIGVLLQKLNSTNYIQLDPTPKLDEPEEFSLIVRDRMIGAESETGSDQGVRLACPATRGEGTTQWQIDAGLPWSLRIS
jgi:hypothetical protein